MVNLLSTLPLLVDAMVNDPLQVNYSRAEVDRLRRREFLPAGKFYDRAIGHRQFTLYSDTNHSDRRINAYFFSPANAHRLIDHGIRHVILERPPEMQPFYDALGQGKIDEEQFIVAMNQFAPAPAKDMPVSDDIRNLIYIMASFLRKMHEHGISVHCIDDRSNLKKEELDSVFKWMTDILLYAESRGANPPMVHTRMVFSFMLNKLFNEISGAGNDGAGLENIKEDALTIRNLLKIRLQDDEKLAANIRAAVGAHPCAILFGAGHGSGTQDLDDYLGRDNVLRVEIYGAAELYADKLAVKRRQAPGFDSPHYLHTLDNGRVYTLKGLDI